MFPNVRLLIGTVFIAVLVLSCEFGVFATLRVNREPLNRLTAESTPLQLAAGHDVPATVAMSWTAPREIPPPAADAAAPHIATDVARSATPIKQIVRVIETPAPATSGADGAVNNEATAAVPQPAPTPPPAAAPMQQDPGPPAMSAAPPANEPTPPAASAVTVQDPPAAAIGTAAGAPEHDHAATPPALAAAPAQQIAAPAADAPALAQPAQPAPDQRAPESAAKASEPAADAPPAAASAPVAAPAAQSAKITGSVPDAATPAPVMPEAVKPPAKAAAKAAHKPAKKARKAERKPAPAHPAKRRIVRRARAPVAASAAQPASTFENPVFESAPQLQRPAKKQRGTKKAATNTGFGAPYGTQFGTQ